MIKKININKKKLKQIDLIVQIAQLLKANERKDDMSMKDWVKVLFHMHKKGWLYVIVNNDKVELAIGGYKVKEVPKEEVLTLPDEEEGNIFYIPFYVPEEKPLPIGATKRFFKNDPDIERIVFESNDGEIKEIKRYHKEKKDEQAKEDRSRATANV